MYWDCEASGKYSLVVAGFGSRTSLSCLCKSTLFTISGKIFSDFQIAVSYCTLNNILPFMEYIIQIAIAIACYILFRFRGLKFLGNGLVLPSQPPTACPESLRTFNSWRHAKAFGCLKRVKLLPPFTRAHMSCFTLKYREITLCTPPPGP